MALNGPERHLGRLLRHRIGVLVATRTRLLSVRRSLSETDNLRTSGSAESALANKFRSH